MNKKINKGAMPVHRPRKKAPSNQTGGNGWGQKLASAIREKLQGIQVAKELLFYVAVGLETRTKALSEQSAQAERLYCHHYGIEGESHLYRREAGALDLPNKVLCTLERAGICQIRDLVILSQYEDGLRKIRMLGSTSEAQIVAHLQSTGLLPSRYEKIASSPCCMKPDRELAAFCNLNQFYIN